MSESEFETRQQQSSESKQCRICLDGAEPTLGRLIKPCLCKGSISYVHVKCLQQWRNTSTSRDAFWACPQCHYRYHFARTRVVGLATNPVVVASVSTVFFTILVLLSSFLTTAFLGLFQQGSTNSPFFFSYYTFYPIDTFQNLVASTLSILNDEFGIIEDDAAHPATLLSPLRVKVPAAKPPGTFLRLTKRFLLGLPLVGMASLVQMLLSMPLLGPVHWVAQYRRQRSRRGSNRDTAAIIVLLLLLVGAARALMKVYDLTQRMSKRMLLRAEDIILEVG